MKANRRSIYLIALMFIAVLTQMALGQSATEYSERARDASLSGKHEEAIVLYAKAIELQPYSAIYSLRSFEYEALGNLELALADVNKAIELESSTTRYKRIERRAQLYVHMGKYNLAVADYDSVLAAFPGRSRNYQNRAEANLIGGKPDFAYADIVKFFQSEDPEDGIISNAVFVGYLSLRKAGKTDEARKFIDEAAPQFDQSRFEAKIARFLKGDLTAPQLLADPNGDPGWAHFYIGEMLLFGGDVETAAEHFRFVRDKGTKYTFGYDLAVVELSRMPAPKTVYRRNAEVFVENGRQLLVKGDPNGAIVSFTKAIEIDPTYADAYVERGTAYGNVLMKWDLGAADLTRVLALRPDDPATLYNRATAYLALGKADLALADASKMISVRPGVGWSYECRAKVRIRETKFDLAIADYTKAISLDPGEPWHYRYRAFAEFAEGQNANAYKDVTAALKLNLSKTADTDQGAVVIGYLALLKQGKASEAHAFIENSLQTLKAKEWSTGIINFMNGDVTEEQLLSQADNKEKLTLYHAYIGEILLARNQAGAAKPHLIWVYENGDKNTDEYNMVIREIVRQALKQ